MNALTPNIFAETARSNAPVLPDWLAPRRAEAIRTLEAQGLPHRRVEAWKYTDLKPALESVDGSLSATAAWSIEKIPAGVTVFDLADLSKAPPWVQAHFGKAAAAETMPAASLALARAGFALHVARDKTVDEPLRVA